MVVLHENLANSDLAIVAGLLRDPLLPMLSHSLHPSDLLGLVAWLFESGCMARLTSLKFTGICCRSHRRVDHHVRRLCNIG